MDPHEYCQTKAAPNGSSLYYSFLFLPVERRRAVTAIHAFCREVDDVVAECTDAGVARVKLAWWRQEVANLFHGKPQHPVARAIAEVAGPHHIAETRLQEIIDGVALELDYNRYPDFSTLKGHCQRVAGVAGPLTAAIYGYQDRRTLEYAADLALAFQLTRIIRDLGGDARRNRINIPLDELAHHGVSEGDIAQGRETQGFARLMAAQIERALEHYDQAFAKLPDVDRKAQQAGIIMAAIYQALLEEIRRDGCHVLTRRTSLTPVRKLWIAWRTRIKG